MCGGTDALDARAVIAALTHIVKEKALPSEDMGIRDENIEEAAVAIPEDVIEELEALRELPRKPPNSQEAYDLHYPKPELLSMLDTIVTFFEKVVKYLPRTKILEALQLTVEPYLEDSPLLDCPEGVDKSHARDLNNRACPVLQRVATTIRTIGIISIDPNLTVPFTQEPPSRLPLTLRTVIAEEVAQAVPVAHHLAWAGMGRVHQPEKQQKHHGGTSASARRRAGVKGEGEDELALLNLAGGKRI
ncbi:hypothetical protein HPB52_005884 [Rhipicephalus sanguineus]|uniref:Uncharacterized protein n=1 Tax=Rhipicephalus sanguineus TaxID=34632 RepID=A0A9D4PPY5_RHISA|nr:hypothetical protein HPB52_005884 [Rhipicephalus sanguineus]